MELSFETWAIVARTPDEAYEAVADPDQLSRYFTTGGAIGRLERGATVTWDFHDFPGAFPVDVLEAVPGRRIVLRWAANEASAVEGEAPPAYQTHVVLTFEPVDSGRTKVTIAESGWRETPAGLKASYGNCMGWSQMLCALKLWLEHGLNLREGMYK